MPLIARTDSPMATEYECPSCGASVDADAKECPKCGEIFDEAALQTDTEAATPREASRRERFLFYGGVLLVLAGGPGIALGSWLHDLLRIPILGSAFDAFGWVNRLVAAVGLVVLIVGIVLLVLSMRFGASAIDTDYDVGSPRKT
ncbi:MAG TPA: zinc ribbon domain-containing protein [Thermoplasmata archaeon]|nr:zinc ribbon domain-containing protein [Thermoplasmata archaeon]